jgi:gluconate kinase
VTGAAGTGKSSLCARLAGTIPGAVLLDTDIFALDMVSVVPPNDDYQAFWRSMIRLGHELAQNEVVVVYFSTMLPEQLLANSDELSYFESVDFLALNCDQKELRARIVKRDGDRAGERVRVWADFNDALLEVAEQLPAATIVDAGRPLDLVERDVRDWITERVRAAEGLRRGR